MLSGTIASRRVALAIVLSGCGPQTASEGADAAGTGTDATGTGMDEAGTGADATGTVTDATSDGGSTGVEPVDPTGMCDPWTQQFTVGLEDLAGASAVVVDAGGLVYAAGFINFADDNLDTDGWLHALSAEGAPRWEVRYDRDTLRQAFSDVAIAPSGDVIVVGFELISEPASLIGEPEVVAIVIRYSPAGEMLWRTEIDGMAQNHAKVAVGSDDRIVVATTLQGACKSPGAVSIAYLAATGELVESWVPLADPYSLPFGPADVQLDTDGSLYLLATGTLADSAMRAEWVGRWDAAGSFLGAFVHEEEGAEAIAVNPREGGALVLGRTEDGQALRRYDASGVELWSHTVLFDLGLWARDLATDRDGQALVVADFWDGEVFQNWLFRFDDAGEELARINIGTEYGWTFESVDMDPCGNAVLAGRAWGLDDPASFVVRKYAR